MALIKCNDCGKEFSDKAKACPNCGCPNKKEVKIVINSKNRKQFFTGFIVIVFIFTTIIILLNKKTNLAGNYLRENDVYSWYITLYEYGDCYWSTYSGEDLIWEYSNGYVLIKPTSNTAENLGICKYKNNTLECEDKGSSGLGDGRYIKE